MKISIITPTYNSEKYLKDTIESVINQTHKEIEYIIIDGKSSDATLKIIEEYAEKNRNIIKYISEKDCGIYDAMNKALAMVTGDFFIFLGSDDIFYDEKILEKVNSKLKNKNAVYYGDVILKTKNEKYFGEFNKYKFLSFNICHQSIFYSKKFVDKKYNLEYKVLADYVYNLEIYASKNEFIYLGEIISIYNDEGFSSNTVDKKFVEQKYRIVYENFGLITTIFRIFISPIYFRIKKVGREKCQKK